jgi:hypothetical protein
MAELLIAVVILGIGLLITSSMFPIAWYKAREVAESAIIPSLANTAETHLKLACRPSRPQPDPANPMYTSSFFPGDWFPAIQGAPEPAVVYPDTRVHHLSTGNYLADTAEDFVEEPPGSGTFVPVADDSWKLEDNLDVMLRDTMWALAFFGNSDTARGPQLRAHARLSPPMEARRLARENPDPLEVAHWEERFELRRHCWSVFYKFNDLPGLEYSIFSQDLNGDGNPLDQPDVAQKYIIANQRMKQKRTLTAYFFTLKRPVGARYVRQEGFDPDSSASKPIDPANPIAMPNTPTEPNDVRLPVPWRFEAELVTLPSDGQPGVPSEILVTNALMANVLDAGFVLLDDRTGQVMKVTNRREVSGGVVLTLDRDYTAAEIEKRPDYEPALRDNGSISEKAIYNWMMAGEWSKLGCDIDPNTAGCDVLKEDAPEKRTFWVFLPPVDAERNSDGTPNFNGSQPVVGVEMRQITL